MYHLIHRILEHQDPTGDNMKVKSAKNGVQQQDALMVKTESELEDGCHEVLIHRDDLIIQIKEEPHSLLISGEHGGDPASCSDTQPDSSKPDSPDQQAKVKEEWDSDHNSEYELTEAGVKEESESWLKDERGGEEERGDSTESPSELFPCPHCSVSFTDINFLEKHVKWVHQKQYLAKLTKYLSGHTPNLITKTEGNLRVHAREIHPSGSHVQCPECGKKLCTPQGLEDHMHSHTGDNPFVCKNCCRRFVERSHWRQHMKIHSGEKPHKCQVCGKAFKGAHHLKSHLTTHTGERPFHCTVCGNRFIRLSHLQNHQRTHTGERPYKCIECDKSFTQSGDLVKHKRIHSGEKPFECPDCHRSYTSSGDLGKHRRSHTNLRPYTCQECGKTFRLSGHLKSHMVTHTGEKPYSCPNCFRSFARAHHLSGHMAKCC